MVPVFIVMVWVNTDDNREPSPLSLHQLFNDDANAFAEFIEGLERADARVECWGWSELGVKNATPFSTLTGEAFSFGKSSVTGLRERLVDLVFPTC